MQYTICGILGVCLLIGSGVANARDFHDMEFADRLSLPGTEQVLQLNGIGYRSKFFIKVYIGALYTQKPATSRDAVLAQTGPRRMLMHFVYDEVSAEKLVSAWNEGFEDNSTPEKLSALRPRIDQFNAMFTDMHEGDLILIDYIPGKGTLVNIKGEDKGVIEGEGFNQALMDIWLGEDPADGGLKDALLGE